MMMMMMMMDFRKFDLSYHYPKLTSVSCHVTVNLERVPTLLRVDPVLAVSFGVS